MLETCLSGSSLDISSSRVEFACFFGLLGVLWLPQVTSCMPLVLQTRQCKQRREIRALCVCVSTAKSSPGQDIFLQCMISRELWTGLHVLLTVFWMMLLTNTE